MTVTYHPDLVQGGDEWFATRRGLLTASEMGLIITPTLKIADNDKSRAHLYELLAQRITGYTEPSYVGYDMLRGKDEEIEARIAYAANYAPVTDCGFITNDRWGFTLGFSPDGLVGDDGLIECKSRRQKFQVETIISQTVPAEFMIQIQTELLVSERAWCDFISYCGGMPMVTIRVEPDPTIQAVIIAAAAGFEDRLQARLVEYRERLGSGARLVATERVVEVEMYVEGDPE